MNKAQLVDAINKKATEQGNNHSKKVIEDVVSTITEVIMDTVASGEKVTLVGFGSFERRERKEREGRNPKTGAKMMIPATSVPAFSAGKTFKERVHPDGGEFDDEE